MFMIKINNVTLISLLSLLLVVPALACRFNVRDVGFVDLETKLYHFYGFVKDDTPTGQATQLKQAAVAVLLPAAIPIEIVNTDQNPTHPALKYLPEQTSRKYPAAALVAPDDRHLTVSLPAPDQFSLESIKNTLAGLLDSPKRRQIQQQVADAYAAILLFEGPDPARNQTIRKEAAAAVKEIELEMQILPKLIARPPVTITLKQNELASEKVLLWALGLDADKIFQPVAAVLYGRARRMGPVLTGDEINQTNLYRLLAIIGADCECGLDRAWMQGPILPLTWGRELMATITEQLGFDPESPMIKMEISRIVGRGYGSGPAPSLDSFSDVPFGYQELVVEFEDDTQFQSTPLPDPPTADPEPNQAGAAATNQPKPTPETTPEETIDPEEYKSIRNAAYLMGGICILVFICGVIILMRTTRRS